MGRRLGTRLVLLQLMLERHHCRTHAGQSFCCSPYFIPHSAQQLSSDLEAATAVASDVTTTIMAQRLELDNKNKTVEILQKALSQQRELTVYHAREMEKEGQKRLELQREEYESAVQRHQCFIDQVSRREEEEELRSLVSHGFCASLVLGPSYCLVFDCIRSEGEVLPENH